MDISTLLLGRKLKESVKSLYQHQEHTQIKRERMDDHHLVVVQKKKNIMIPFFLFRQEEQHHEQEKPVLVPVHHDYQQSMSSDNYDQIDQECKLIRRDSMKKCLINLHDHCIHFFESHHHDRDEEEDCKNDSPPPNSNKELVAVVQQEEEAEHMQNNKDKTIGVLSYEDWIQVLHPENVISSSSPPCCSKEESKRRRGGGGGGRRRREPTPTIYVIDHRFYVRDSDHRIIWNSYCDMYGYSDLKVDYRDSSSSSSSL